MQPGGPATDITLLAFIEKARTYGWTLSSERFPSPSGDAGLELRELVRGDDWITLPGDLAIWDRLHARVLYSLCRQAQIPPSEFALPPDPDADR